jgi:solute carrier family 34 (sodium-dependent phosphate cotransporter)
MFLMGAAITLISMSVSVSLSILVPLSNRGFIRRENVIPYIMGANITTFIDTLLAGVLLNSSQAITVVFVQMLSILIVSVVVLMTFFRSYERSMLAFAKLITANNRNLFIFMACILIVPVILIAFINIWKSTRK